MEIMAFPVQSTSTDAAPAGIFNTFYIWLVSGVGALGGLLFGYDWVVIGGAKPFYEKYFGLGTAAEQGWAMSCALIGCLFGAMIAGSWSERFGRKWPLIFAALTFAVSSLGTAASHTFPTFVLWRVIGGFAIGLASSLSPLYIAELAPAHLRGKLVSLNQMTIVIGILMAQAANWLIAKPIAANATALEILNSWNGQTGWRVMFAVTAIPAVLFLFAMFFVPESPRWLTQKGRISEAEKTLMRVGGLPYCRVVSAEMQASLGVKQESDIWRLLLQRKMLKVLGLGMFLAVLQQWCGINVIFNYAEEVFSAAGYKVSDILFNIVVTGIVNVLFTLIALRTVDRYGRRKLMLIGSSGLAVIYAVLGLLYHLHSQGIHMLILVVAAIGCYAMSLAPVTWVVISEIFPGKVRGAAVSLAVTVLWIACFLLTYTFPLLNRVLGAAGTFWIYAIICAIGFCFLLLRLPETKGKSLEAIEQMFE